MRQAAVRLFTARSISVVARPRTITSFSSRSLRPTQATAQIQFQRRWASNEAEAKKEEEVPVSQLQPTPEEEVENAIHEDAAATSQPNQEASPQVAESANLTEATEEATTTAHESQSVQEAVDSAPSVGSVTDAAASLTEGLTSAPRDERRPLREPATPKSTIYVGNLFFDVTENDLSKEFGRFGNIQRTRLIRDARGLSKG